MYRFVQNWFRIFQNSIPGNPGSGFLEFGNYGIGILVFWNLPEFQNSRGGGIVEFWNGILGFGPMVVNRVYIWSRASLSFSLSLSSIYARMYYCMYISSAQALYPPPCLSIDATENLQNSSFWTPFWHQNRQRLCETVEQHGPA